MRSAGGIHPQSALRAQVASGGSSGSSGSRYEVGNALAAVGPSRGGISAFDGNGIDGLCKIFNKGLKIPETGPEEEHGREVRRVFREFDKTMPATIEAHKASFFGASVLQTVKLISGFKPGCRSVTGLIRHALTKRNGKVPEAIGIMLSSGYSLKSHERGDGFEGMCYLQLIANTDVSGVKRAISLNKGAVDAIEVVYKVQKVDGRIRHLWDTMPADGLSETTAFEMLALQMKLDVEDWLSV